MGRRLHAYTGTPVETEAAEGCAACRSACDSRSGAHLLAVLLLKKRRLHGLAHDRRDIRRHGGPSQARSRHQRATAAAARPQLSGAAWRDQGLALSAGAEAGHRAGNGGSGRGPPAADAAKRLPPSHRSLLHPQPLSLLLLQSRLLDAAVVCSGHCLMHTRCAPRCSLQTRLQLHPVCLQPLLQRLHACGGRQLRCRPGRRLCV